MSPVLDFFVRTPRRARWTGYWIVAFGTGGLLRVTHSFGEWIAGLATAFLIGCGGALIGMAAMAEDE